VTQGTANFGVYSRRVVDAIRSLREHSQPFGLAALWVGFRRLEIAVEHSARAHGRSTYTVRKLVRLALEGMTTSSDRPLRLTLLVGSLISLSSIVGFVLAAVFALLTGAPPSGWISLIAFQVLTLGLLMTTLGIVGVYVGQTFTQTKYRPRYVIRETTALGKREET
jgi:dolichol-phosphate mannosyltransferase